MTTLTLYYTPGTCAQAVRIALEEAGAAHHLVRVDFAAGQQRTPEYLAINPKGRVPALVTPQGTLTETPALLAYVAQSYPAAQLAPTDAYGFARLQEFQSYLASTVHIAHAHRPRASRWADEPEAQAAMQRKVAQNMIDCFNLIETHYLGDGPWVMGEQYTVADGYLFTIGTWLQSDGVDIAQFPKVHAHTQRVLQRPAVQRALA
ncbi:glutathione S-transferase family protein [Acidovorax sp. 1608163]|uniref:glutathione S-transferase family protein n=1 Tax=Acidovorax sp. 1608163 TaxID=2478662 RepID=UPI000EF69E25|nr:glutathione S-transferase family protein [Acidovorax sp. 1608163]AYM98086.1 glutathione S-transferase family protein [Acidovorax sp. 1608163]